MKFTTLSTRTVLAALALTLGGAAMAQAPAAAPGTATPRIDQREVNQQNRINQGVASGQLTAKETAHLQKREARIQSNEAAAKADGKVTVAERRHLRREQNRASGAIHHQKHDRQTTAPAA